MIDSHYHAYDHGLPIINCSSSICKATYNKMSTVRYMGHRATNSYDHQKCLLILMR